MISETGAYVEMCVQLRAIVGSTGVRALLGYTPDIRYVDVRYDKDPPKDKAWLRITLMQGGVKKRTLGSPSRITYQGVCDVQQFVPVTADNPAEIGRKLADMILTMYSKSTANVDFYAASIRDMPREDAWFYKRVNATYNFDNYA